MPAAIKPNGIPRSWAVAIETTFDWPMSTAPEAPAAAMADPFEIVVIVTVRPAARKKPIDSAKNGCAPASIGVVATRTASGVCASASGARPLAATAPAAMTKPRRFIAPTASIARPEMRL